MNETRVKMSKGTRDQFEDAWRKADIALANDMARARGAGATIKELMAWTEWSYRQVYKMLYKAGM